MEAARYSSSSSSAISSTRNWKLYQRTWGFNISAARRCLQLDQQVCASIGLASAGARCMDSMQWKSKLFSQRKMNMAKHPPTRRSCTLLPETGVSHSPDPSTSACGCGQAQQGLPTHNTAHPRFGCTPLQQHHTYLCCHALLCCREQQLLLLRRLLLIACRPGAWAALMAAISCTGGGPQCVGPSPTCWG